MAKHAGAFKSEKRKKELQRMKKNEEKRQKRLKKDTTSEADIELTATEGIVAEGTVQENPDLASRQD